MIILQTARLILRDFTMQDLDEIYALVYADPLVKDTWSGAQGTPEELKTRFAQRHILPGDPFGLKAVAIKETSRLIGLMGFQKHEPAQGEEIYYLLTRDVPRRTVNFDPECLEVELTYALGRDYWKKGYATEIGQALIDYGFQTLGIGRILQGVLAGNRNSIDLMRRLGFRVEPGLRPEFVVGVLEKPKERD